MTKEEALELRTRCAELEGELSEAYAKLAAQRKEIEDLINLLTLPLDKLARHVSRRLNK